MTYEPSSGIILGEGFLWKEMQEITNKTKRYLELAKRLAHNSDYLDHRHGAVLTKSGRIINVSFNKNHYNSFAARFKKVNVLHATQHAELGSLLGVDRSKTTGATVYVVRIIKLGDTKMSKPCAMCEEAMRFCGVKKVVYSVNEKNIESIRL